MDKKRNLATAGVIYGVLLVIYNLIVLIAFKEKNGVYWLSYGFTLLAFVCQAGSMFLSFRKSDVQTAFFGIPLASFSIYYLIAQAVVGIIFMIFQKAPIALAVIIQVIILGAFIIVGAISLWARDTVIEHNEQLTKNVRQRNFQYADIAALMNRCEDPAFKEKLRKASETVKYSDPIGNPAVAETEIKIEQTFIQLRSSLESGDLAAAEGYLKEFELLYAERNTRLKYAK